MGDGNHLAFKRRSALRSGKWHDDLAISGPKRLFKIFSATFDFRVCAQAHTP